MRSVSQGYFISNQKKTIVCKFAFFFFIVMSLQSISRYEKQNCGCAVKRYVILSQRQEKDGMKNGVWSLKHPSDMPRLAKKKKSKAARITSLRQKINARFYCMLLKTSIKVTLFCKWTEKSVLRVNFPFGFWVIFDDSVKKWIVSNWHLTVILAIMSQLKTHNMKKLKKNTSGTLVSLMYGYSNKVWTLGAWTNTGQLKIDAA